MSKARDLANLLADGSVGTSELADGAVTEAKIGTGAVTANKLAAGAAVPSQSGQSGKFLTTDGTNASWETVNTDLVSDTTPQLGGNLDLNTYGVTGSGSVQIQGSGNNLFKGTSTGSSGSYITFRDANTDASNFGWVGQVGNSLSLWSSNAIENLILKNNGDVIAKNNHFALGNNALNVTNDGGWHGRLNVSGTNHAKVQVSETVDGIKGEMMAHQGHGSARFGSNSNHGVALFANGTVCLDIDNTGNWKDAPPGTVIQQRTYFDSGYHTVNNSSWIDVFTFTFTPRNSGSKLIIELNLSTLNEASNRHDFWLGHSKSSSYSSWVNQAYFYATAKAASVAGWHMQNSARATQFSAGAGTSYFKLRFSNPDGNTAYYNYSNGTSSIIVTEVTQ